MTTRRRDSFIRAVASAALAGALALAASTTRAQTCPFDDGNSSLAVEGLILTRYALGITGAPLVMSTGIDAVDAPTVEAAINCPSCGLNITGNATLTVADATIISRRLAGFSGDALTANLDLGTGIRNTPLAVQSFLLAGCGATGGTVTSIIAGTGLTGGTITGAGTIAADTAYLQRRVTQTCGAGASISAIDALGNVTCQIAGAGTVTQVQTGAGLTGGPINGAGTINLASTQLLPTTACATDQIAKWNGSAWVCSAPSPAFPSCLTGQVVRVGVSGALQCGSLPNSIATHRQGTNLVGQRNSLAIGSDGLPLVAYSNSNSSQLLLLKCGNTACTSNNTTAVADSGASFADLSLAVPADGLPVIGYYDVSANNLKVVKCGNATCSSGNLITAVDSAGIVGQFSSLAVPPDGRPVISYQDFSNSTLKMVKCGNAACSNGNAFSVVDSVAVLWTSIAIGADGFPVIAYHDNVNKALKVAKCADASCATSSTSTVDTTAAVVGEYSSITVPSDGRPVVSYYDRTNTQFKVAQCGNAACNSGNIRSVVDSLGSVGSYTSIAIGADGLAVVAYRDATNSAMKFVKCGNASCTLSGRIISTLDSGNETLGGYSRSVAVPPDGLPIISYHDDVNGTLKIIKCSNTACVFP